jgi:hypothetical protein
LGGVSDFLPIEYLGNRVTGTRSWSVLPQSITNVKNAWHDATCAPPNIFIAFLIIKRAKELTRKSALFWDVTQRRTVIC